MKDLGGYTRGEEGKSRSFWRRARRVFVWKEIKYEIYSGGGRDVTEGGL